MPLKLLPLLEDSFCTLTCASTAAPLAEVLGSTSADVLVVQMLVQFVHRLEFASAIAPAASRWAFFLLILWMRLCGFLLESARAFSRESLGFSIRFRLSDGRKRHETVFAMWLLASTPAFQIAAPTGTWRILLAYSYRFVKAVVLQCILCALFFVTATATVCRFGVVEFAVDFLVREGFPLKR
jgi:hypothetical protein